MLSLSLHLRTSTDLSLFHLLQIHDLQYFGISKRKDFLLSDFIIMEKCTYYLLFIKYLGSFLVTLFMAYFLWIYEHVCFKNWPIYLA